MVSSVGGKDPKIATGCETLELACEYMWNRGNHAIRRIARVNVEAGQLSGLLRMWRKNGYIRVGVLRTEDYLQIQ